MKKLHFTTTINAKRPAVWNAMIGQDTFRDWTAEFAPGSYFEGSWEQGASIRFLTPDGSGMTSKIAVSRPYEVISIRHLGVIKDGVVDTTSSEAAGWAGCTETYSFADSGPWTVLTVEADSPPEFDEFMKQTWPKALARLKAICET